MHVKQLATCVELRSVLHELAAALRVLPPSAHSVPWYSGCRAVSKLCPARCDGRRTQGRIKCRCKQIAPHCLWGMRHGVSEGWIFEEHPIRNTSARESWLCGSRSSGINPELNNRSPPHLALGSISPHSFTRTCHTHCICIEFDGSGFFKKFTPPTTPGLKAVYSPQWSS